MCRFLHKLFFLFSLDSFHIFIFFLVFLVVIARTTHFVCFCFDSISFFFPLVFHSFGLLFFFYSAYDTFNFQVFALRCLGFKYECIKSCCPDISHPIQKLPVLYCECVFFCYFFASTTRNGSDSAQFYYSVGTRIDKHSLRSLLIHHSVFIFSLLSVPDALLFNQRQSRLDDDEDDEDDEYAKTHQPEKAIATTERALASCRALQIHVHFSSLTTLPLLYCYC